MVNYFILNSYHNLLKIYLAFGYEPNREERCKMWYIVLHDGDKKLNNLLFEYNIPINFLDNRFEFLRDSPNKYSNELVMLFERKSVGYEVSGFTDGCWYEDLIMDIDEKNEMLLKAQLS